MMYAAVHLPQKLSQLLSRCEYLRCSLRLPRTKLCSMNRQCIVYIQHETKPKLEEKRSKTVCKIKTLSLVWVAPFGHSHRINHTIRDKDEYFVKPNQLFASSSSHSSPDTDGGAMWNRLRRCWRYENKLFSLKILVPELFYR